MVVAVMLWSEFRIDRFSKNPGWLNPRLSRETSRIKSGKQDLSFIVGYLQDVLKVVRRVPGGTRQWLKRGSRQPAENISSTKLASGVGKQK
jgi:hypothetical protein